jgi:heat shock protein HslJ
VRVAVVVGGLSVALGSVVAWAAPTANTSYSFRSEAGDYIGAGQTQSYQSPPATITANGTAAAVTVSVTSGGDWWNIELAAPRGDVLRPGVYRDAERAAFRTGRSPGLDVFGNGRGCNEVFGQFTIDQVETDPSGSISVLDAHFTQRCESATAPRLLGTVHYRAFPLSYKFVSDPGDYIGGGKTKSYTNSTTVFGLSGTTAGITYTVSGQRDDWRVQFAPPAGQQLHVGTYTDAQRAPFHDPTHPGLEVSGDGRGCNTLTGSFKITQLVVDGTGAVKALAATYEQHCEGGAPALRGTIHYFA